MSQEKQPTVNQDDLQQIINATINQIHEAQAVKLQRPNTIRGWMMIMGMIAGLIGFIWTSVVFLNDVAEHHTQPYHPGAEELVTAVKQAHLDHIQTNELHRREEQLQLQILKETKPITESIQVIKQDVRSIETKLDIIIDRQTRNN